MPELEPGHNYQRFNYSKCMYSALNGDRVIYVYVIRWNQLQKKLTDTVQNGFAGELGSPLIAKYPFMTPAYLSQGFKVVKATHPPDKPKLEQLPYAIHFMYGLDFNPVNDMEFAFPVDFKRPDGFDCFLQAIDVVVEELSKAAKPCEELNLL